MTDLSMDDASQGVVDTTEPGALPETNAADTGQVAEAGTPATPEVTPPAEPETQPQAKPDHWANKRLGQYAEKVRGHETTIAEQRRQIEELNRRLNPQGQAPDATRQPTVADVDRLANERAETLTEQREQQRAIQAWNEAGEKASPTFRQDCEMLLNLGARENPVATHALMDLDDAPKVIARLAADPAEAERIFALAPHRAAVALAKFAAKAPTPPPVSRTPAPITPVAGAAKVDADPNSLSDDEWWRRQQSKAK